MPVSSVRTRRLVAFLVFNLLLILACLPGGFAGNSAVTPVPFTLLTPTPLPPTPTPTITPLPTPPPGTVVQEMTRKHETLSTEQADRVVAEFLYGRNLVPSKYAVDTYRIWFRTRDAADQIVSVQADIRFPRVDEPQTFPIFIYGAGTTGIATECAPLNEYFAGREWGDYRAHMTSYAAQGYIAVIANWQGFDDWEQTHPYFIADLEGRVMLDAAQATYDFFAHPPEKDILARPADAVFMGGYSQGGHGTFAAARIASTYAPQIQLKGLIGHAASPDVEGLMCDSPRYSPYIVYAYRDAYGPDIIDPAEVFQPHWLETFDQDTTTKCVDEALSYYSDDPARLYTPAFRQALYNDRLAEAYPAFKAELDANDSNDKTYPFLPILILHGAADPIVKQHTIQSFVSYLCSQGENVTFKLYSGVNHFQARQNSFLDTLTWMGQVLEGNIPAANCPNQAGS